MNLMDMYIPYLPITAFWITYLIGITIFPRGNVHTRGIIFVKDIYKQTYKNIIASVMVIPLLNKIPVIYSFQQTWLGLGLKLIVSLLLMEIWFYYTHRLFHHRFFYSFHKDHHSFVKSNVLSGLYCSIPEMILVNQMSIAVPFRLFDYNTTEMILVSSFIALNVIKGHATFQDIPNVFSSFIPVILYQNWDHDNHHRLMIYNYGLLSILDRLHGTRYERTQEK